jgi:hypothetical protein
MDLRSGERRSDERDGFSPCDDRHPIRLEDVEYTENVLGAEIDVYVAADGGDRFDLKLR